MNRAKPRQELEDLIAAGDLKRLMELGGLLHGHFCPGLALGIKAAFRAVKELRAYSTGMEEVVAIVETNSCFADGVQMVTGCTLGNNGLIYRDYGKTAVTLARRSGEAVRVAVKAGGNVIQRNPEAAALYKKVITDRVGTPEENERLRKVWIETSFSTLEIPDEELFNIKHLNIQMPAYAKVHGSAICSVCGESIMEPRARLKDGKPVCLACANQGYFELDGNGLKYIVR